MRGQRLVFVQFYISRTNYHARTDWLQHHIKLVTRVPANFQQKTNLALSDRLDPQNFLVFSAQTRYTNGASSMLFLIFVLEINSIKKTQWKVISIESVRLIEP